MIKIKKCIFSFCSVCTDVKISSRLCSKHAVTFTDMNMTFLEFLISKHTISFTCTFKITFHTFNHYHLFLQLFTLNIYVNLNIYQIKDYKSSQIDHEN